MAGYSARLLDYARHPQHGGAIEGAAMVGRSSLEGRAPYTTIYLDCHDGIIHQASFQTFGCGVSIAACEALCEWLTGRRLANCDTISQELLIERLDGVPYERQFCLALAINALRDALGTPLVPITPRQQFVED